MRKFRQAPIEIQIFAIFSAFVTLFGYTIVFFKEINEKIIPYTGWGISTTYSFALIFVYSYIFGYSGKRISLNRLKISVFLFMAIHMLAGFSGITESSGRKFETNPYLAVSEYRYVWVLIVPLFWILLFAFSPNLKTNSVKS